MWSPSDLGSDLRVGADVVALLDLSEEDYRYRTVPEWTDKDLKVPAARLGRQVVSPLS